MISTWPEMAALLSSNIMKITSNQVIAAALVVIASPIALIGAGVGFSLAQHNVQNAEARIAKDGAVLATALPAFIAHPACVPAMAWAQMTGGPYDVISATRKHCN